MRTADEMSLAGGYTETPPLLAPAPVPTSADMDMDSPVDQSPTSASTAQDTQSPPSVTAMRPSSSSTVLLRDRNRAEMNGHALGTLQTRSNGALVKRPSMLRAKSDFGPRHDPEPPESIDEASSADENFKIRHGWDDQLNSEEYNNLLTSVRLKRIAE
jgi:regulator-associated protein of mTOR